MNSSALYVAPAEGANRAGMDLTDEMDRAQQTEPPPEEGELHFRRLLEKLPAGAYTCDPEGLITYFNQHAVELWGRAPKLNDPVDRYCGSFKLFRPDGSPIAHDQCWMALALKMDKEYNRREIVIERPDGQRLTALAHANPIHDEPSGKLLGAVNVLVDITDRKRVEENLHRQEEVFRSLSASSPVGIFLTDLEDRCTYANPRCQAICGVTFEEILGKGWTCFVHPEEQDRVLEGWLACAQEGREYSGEFRFINSTEGTRWVHVRSSPLFSGDGDLLGHVGTVEDITERKRAEQALQEIREGERRRIARDLHDVVLQDLAGAVQSVQAAQVESKAPEMDSDLKHAADALRRANQGLRNAIHDLRLEATQPFVRAAKSLVELNHQLTPERKVVLMVDDGFPPDLPEKTGVELLRVLQEALANTRQHSRARHVEAKLRLYRGEVVAEVVDDGRGFNPEAVWDGVGLSGMRERVDALGGELEVRSESGKGTHVIAKVPLPAT